LDTVLCANRPTQPSSRIDGPFFAKLSLPAFDFLGSTAIFGEINPNIGISPTRPEGQRVSGQEVTNFGLCQGLSPQFVIPASFLQTTFGLLRGSRPDSILQKFDDRLLNA
jgi:hypothetical protein